MEQERPPTSRKLTDVLKEEFPSTARVLVSFPDKWEYVETVPHEDGKLYIAGFPIERAFTGREHFEGLEPEINVDLVFYRLYKFFQPWPVPQVTMEWDHTQRRGRVMGVQEGKLQMQPVGQAQAWFGVNAAVLWECYLEESRREENDPASLASLWRAIEKDVRAPKLLTLPHEPSFHGDYPEFLKGLGYQPDTETQGWWSKTAKSERTSVTTEETK